MIGQEGISQNPSHSGVTRMKTPSHAPLRVIGKMLRVVAPPGPVIIPEMVEGIVATTPDGEEGPLDDCCVRAHGCWMFRLGETPGIRAIKKRPRIG